MALSLPPRTPSITMTPSHVPPQKPSTVGVFVVMVMATSKVNFLNNNGVHKSSMDTDKNYTDDKSSTEMLVKNFKESRPAERRLKRYQKSSWSLGDEDDYQESLLVRPQIVRAARAAAFAAANLSAAAALYLLLAYHSSSSCHC